MHPVDWALIAVIPALVIWDGVRRGARAKDLEGFLLAGRSVAWWAIGLSVMATQASAITMISITGHGYEHGLRWLHVYLALPFAMVILCATVVPWFTRARVFTAYEYLEQRFDPTTRTLASILFLVSRGLAVGTSLYAPSIVLQVVLGIPQHVAIVLMGGTAAAYTMFGGNAAVIFTDVKQMAVMFIGIGVSLWIALAGLPEHVSVGDAFALAGASRKLEAIHVAPDVQHVLADRYNLVSALLGGLFLFLGYFGADQSQVQRYLAGASTDHSRASLLLSAFVKVPMQFAILLLGALIFVFYIFAPAPVFYRADAMAEAVATAPPAVQEQWRGLEQRFEAAHANRRASAEAFIAARAADGGGGAAADALRAANTEVAALKREANTMFRSLTAVEGGDNDFVFPWFFLRELPVGLLGLVVAAIFVAAMSSLDAQLNSLATSSVMDLWVRFRTDTPVAGVLRLSRWATLFWGLFATVSAFYVARLGQMIEAVNIIGSMFYGSLFGVFLLAWLCPWARGAIGWISLAGGFLCTLFTHFVINAQKVEIDGRMTEPVGFLWYNLIGCVGVVVIGVTIAVLRRRTAALPPPPGGATPSEP
jgi:Na+/proline symporter